MRNSAVESTGRRLHEEEEKPRTWDLTRTFYGSRFRVSARGLPILLSVKSVTGPLSPNMLSAGSGFGASRTGIEYGNARNRNEFRRMQDWGFVFVPDVLARTVEALDDSDNTFDRAAAIAREQPFVESALPEIPQVTGNLVTDARSLAGLTTQQLAELCGVTERTMFDWRDHAGRISAEAEKALRGLRAISAALVGALGPSGVARWLLSGPNAPFEELKAGRVDEVVDRAQQYLDSPAT